MLLLCSVTTFSFSQNIDKIINAAEVKRIETVLSADDMEGRRAFTPGIERAGAFISDEFKKIGLKPLNPNYMQSFSMFRPKIISLSCTVDGTAVDAKNVAVITTQPNLSVNNKSGYEVVKLDRVLGTID